MKLQADPTVVYAMKLKANDFDLIVSVFFIEIYKSNRLIIPT